MRELLEEAILAKCRNLLRRVRTDQYSSKKNARRFERRTGLVAGIPPSSEPTWWQVHPHFDPAYCIRHSKYLAKVIWDRLRNNQYIPSPALEFSIPKPDGTFRQIMAFSIPDAAVANLIHRTATRRNLNLFSRLSYAYRPDQNLFDAIINLSRSLAGPKAYVVQFDFSKYFDSIDHSYLRKVISSQKLFLLPEAERNAIFAFLSHRYANAHDYNAGIFERRVTGVPQGSSLSLFLSNVAAHELDLALEKINGTFVRFADDVVAVAHTYSDAMTIAAVFRQHCRLAGLSINYDKSPGILYFGDAPDREKRTFVIDADDGVEIETVDHLDFLGHRIHVDGIQLPDKTIRRIKRRVSSIIYKHMFLYRRSSPNSFNANRVGAGFFDWDFVTCLNELRNYIYGGLRESVVTRFLLDDQKPPFIRGFMAFFPLVENVEQLRRLDGWLLNIIRRAQRERVKMLQAHFGIAINRLTREEIISGSWYNYPLIENDSSLPSFLRSWRVARKYYFRYGLAGIQAPSYYSLI